MRHYAYASLAGAAVLLASAAAQNNSSPGLMVIETATVYVELQEFLAVCQTQCAQPGPTEHLLPTGHGQIDAGEHFDQEEWCHDCDKSVHHEKPSCHGEDCPEASTCASGTCYEIEVPSHDDDDDNNHQCGSQSGDACEVVTIVEGPSCKTIKDCPDGCTCNRKDFCEIVVGPECRADSDCVKGQACSVVGICEAISGPECTKSADCPSQHICNSRGVCQEQEQAGESECAKNQDCLEGEICTSDGHL